MIYALDNQPISAAYLAPSVSPWRYESDAPYHNPGVNLAQFDDEDFTIPDTTQYYVMFKLTYEGRLQ